VIGEIQPVLEKRFPSVNFQWFQSGSENIAARVNAELSTGKSQADLVLTSDPFWYAELKEKGHLLGYPTEKSAGIPAKFRDTEGAFATVRLPVAVIAYNQESFAKEPPPKSFSDLISARFKNRVSMGSPMESGTFFCVVAQLSRTKGWQYFSQLRQNGVLSAGGNSAVINRLETKERPVGIVLLENVLEAKQRGSKIEIVYPEDGAVWVPSPIAIMAKTHAPELAKSIYDYFFSIEIQQKIVEGRMYSPILTTVPPAGAKPFGWVDSNALEWSPAILQSLYSNRDTIKKQFMDLVMN
jgi:iron(III) transport system substrate-binding protein